MRRPKNAAFVATILVFAAFAAGPGQAQLQGSLDRYSTCNLARNGAFEALTLSPPTLRNWLLKVDSGAGALSILTYPQPVQSGAHAARVTVSQPGDLYLTTAEGRSGVPVKGGTEYRLSVRLRSEPGKLARLGIAEWSGEIGTPPTVHILDEGGSEYSSTRLWTTLEGTFTTANTTRFVSPRLIHSPHAGIFDWDDPMLSVVSKDKLCVDLRHHRAQTTPGRKLCSQWISTGGTLQRWCHDAEKSVLGELVRTTSLYASPDIFERGNFGVLTHNGNTANRLGVHKNIDLGAGSRCFANPGALCGPSSGANAHYPPHSMRLISELPVVDFGTVPISVYNQGNVTLGSSLDHDWQDFDVRTFNPTTGNQGPRVGNINRRQWAFVAASVDFGGDLGVQQNVLVIEEEQISGSIDPRQFGGGKNLERYWFVRGIGRTGQTLWVNTACAANPGPATCNGTYDTNPGGLLSFAIFGANDADLSALPPVAPFNIVDWWNR